MAKNSIDAYGAKGKTNLLFFDPEDLNLVKDKSHPLYDARVDLPLDEAMVRNIMMQGVLEPIVFLKDPETGSIDVVAGRQRVKNAREANRRLAAEGRMPIQVPGYTRRGLDARTAAALMASENAIQQDETPMGRARMMQQLIGLSYTEADLAVIFGCALATVQTSLSLLECTKPVQKAVEDGKINVTHAKALSKLAPAEQREKVQELIEAGASSAKPHERARKQAAIVGGDTPRMRGKKDIKKALETATGEAWLALSWVLGQEERFQLTADAQSQATAEAQAHQGQQSEQTEQAEATA